MDIKVKRLHRRATIPTYAHPLGDAGMDLTAVSVREDLEYMFLEYDTGIALEIPEGYMGLIFPRSSISKTHLSLCNAVGVIDPSYRGPIKLRFNVGVLGRKQQRYAIGDKIGQLIILPYPQIRMVEVDDLSNTDRGDGGFGSTG